MPQRTTNAERRARFGLLLAAVVAVFAIEGIAQRGRWEQVFVSILLAATLVLALWVADVRPGRIRVIAVIAAALVLLTLFAAIENSPDATSVRIANVLLAVLAPPAIVIGILRDLRARNQVTIEAVLGVLCVYLLLGMLFALIYGTIGQLAGSFFSQGVKGTPATYLYFSFTTLTTVGYGDFTAATNLGHTLSVSEALLGQIYLVTVVSVIIGNLGRQRYAAPTSANDESQALDHSSASI